MLPFLHFPSGHKGSCLHDVRQSNPGQGQGILNYSDKKHSNPTSHTTLHTSRGETAAQRGTWFSLSFLRAKVAEAQRDRVTSVSALLPAHRVSSLGLVSLYHTLLITAMTGPLSQRMPYSFSGALGHVFTERAALRLGVLILGREFWLAGLFWVAALTIISLPLEMVKEERLIRLSSQPLSLFGTRRLLKKKKFLRQIFFLFPQGSLKCQNWYPHPALFLCCSPSLWPRAPLFHTAVYYFNQYPPFPLLSLPLSFPFSLSLSLSALN